jgi:transcriptional regulator with XRE-family HTH domain
MAKDEDDDGPVYTSEGDRFRAVMKERRIELGLTQKELGDVIGCSPGYCSEIETGKKQFNEKRMSAICAKLGITITFSHLREGGPTGVDAFFAPFPPEVRPMMEAMRAALMRDAETAFLNEKEVPLVADSLALFQNIYKADRPQEVKQAGKLRRKLTKPE